MARSGVGKPATLPESCSCFIASSGIWAQYSGLTACFLHVEMCGTEATLWLTPAA